MDNFSIDSFLSDNPVIDTRIDKAELPDIETGKSFGEAVNLLMNRINDNFRTGKIGTEDNRALNKNVEYVFDVLETAHNQEGMLEFLNVVAGKLKALNTGNYSKLTPKSYKGTGLDAIIDCYDMDTGFRYCNHPLSLFSALTTNKDSIIEAVK